MLLQIAHSKFSDESLINLANRGRGCLLIIPYAPYIVNSHRVGVTLFDSATNGAIKFRRNSNFLYTGCILLKT